MACKKITFKKPPPPRTVERCDDRKLATSAQARWKRDGGACRADGKFTRCDTEDHEPTAVRRKRERAEEAGRARARREEREAARPPAGVCFRRKSDMLKALVDANRHVMEPCERDTSGASFDPVNHKYDRNGKRKVTTCEQAIRVASPTHGPYCLDQVDLKSLNELAVAKREGGFRLPTKAQAALTEREAREHYRRGLSGFARMRRRK